MDEKQLMHILRSKFGINWPCAERCGSKVLASGQRLVFIQAGMIKVCFGAERRGTKRPVIIAVCNKDWGDCEEDISKADVIAIPLVFEKYNCKVIDPTARFQRREAMMTRIIHTDVPKCAIHHQELSHISLLVIIENRMLFYEPMLLEEGSEAPYIVEAVSLNVKNFLQTKIKRGGVELGPCTFHPKRMTRSFIPLNLCWYAFLFSVEQIALGNFEKIEPFEDEDAARQTVERYWSYVSK